MKFNKSEAV